jgi:hypothetical protein
MGCRLRLNYPGMLCSVQCAYMARTRACSRAVSPAAAASDVACRAPFIRVVGTASTSTSTVQCSPIRCPPHHHLDHDHDYGFGTTSLSPLASRTNVAAPKKGLTEADSSPHRSKPGAIGTRHGQRSPVAASSQQPPANHHWRPSQTRLPDRLARSCRGVGGQPARIMLTQQSSWYR